MLNMDVEDCDTLVNQFYIVPETGPTHEPFPFEKKERFPNVL